MCLLQVLEYRSDLKQYWKRSHGYPISAMSSCPLFHHVFRTLDKAGRPRRWVGPPPPRRRPLCDGSDLISVCRPSNNNNNNKCNFTLRSTDAAPEPASVLLGHAETLLPLLALLGMYKDRTPPAAHNYRSQHGA